MCLDICGAPPPNQSLVSVLPVQANGTYVVRTPAGKAPAERNCGCMMGATTFEDPMLLFALPPGHRYRIRTGPSWGFDATPTDGAVENACFHHDRYSCHVPWWSLVLGVNIFVTPTASNAPPTNVLIDVADEDVSISACPDE